MSRAVQREKKSRTTDSLTEGELTILQSYVEILDQNQVHLTKTLEREQYERIKLIFERLGGVYLPVKRRFAFAIDPTPLLAQTIALRALPKQNPLDFYYSPAEVIDALFLELEWGGTMDDLLWEHEHHGRPIRVLESSAGLGHLADAFRERYPMATIDVCEIDPYRRAVLEQKGYRVVKEDALQYHPIQNQFYDIAFLNPPFTIGGDSFTFIKHIKHAYALLVDSPWSKLVSVVPAQFSRVDRYQDFYIQVLQFGDFEDLPQNAFVEAGTKWETSIISLQKKKNYFYANWDQPEDGYPNLRVKEAWTYIGIDKNLNESHSGLLNDMVEGRLPVYTAGVATPQTQQAIHRFCQEVTHRLLSKYHLYIPLAGDDLTAMEREILLHYQQARQDYSQVKQMEWERTWRLRKSALQKKIEQGKRQIAAWKEQARLQEQQLLLFQSELDEMESSCQNVPTFIPAAEMVPSLPSFQEAQGATALQKHSSPPLNRVPHSQSARYVQHSLFE